MKRFAIAAGCVAVLLAAGSARASGLKLEEWRGHVSFGYAKVFSDSLAPAGSLSVGAGVDYPLRPAWRIGPSMSFNLLGSSPVTRGSVTAGLDYSLFEAALLVTYLPAKGPVTRVSAGPGMASARAELSVAGGGAGFSDLTVGEVKPEFALDATVAPRRLKVVSVGAELGARIVAATQGTWTLVTARLAIHF